MSSMARGHAERDHHAPSPSQTDLPGKRTAHGAISAAGCPPMVAWEGCREHLGMHPCDKRRTMREIAPSFPAVDFSLVGPRPAGARPAARRGSVCQTPAVGLP
jgi:hypothetical protein